MIDLTLVLAVLLAPAFAETAAGEQAKPVEAPQSKPAAAAAPAQESERPAITAAEIKSLRDGNIFAPRNQKRKPPPSAPSSRSSTRFEPAAPAKPKPPLVTGIFFDGKAQAWLVVVEDRNSDSLRQFKEPKFLKTGDEVGGLKVGMVTAEKAIFLKGETSRELKVGESLPAEEHSVSIVPTAATLEDPEAPPVPEVEIKPADAESNAKTLEELKKRRGKKDRPSKDE